MKDTATYNYPFKNGIVTISRGIKTRKYDWYLEVELTKDEDGNKRFFGLNRRLFLTRNHAKETAFTLLKKYNLL